MEESNIDQVLAFQKLPIEMFPVSFKKLLADLIDPSQWKFERIIPLNNYYIGEITCNSPAVKEKFQKELQHINISSASYDNENSAKYTELAYLIPILQPFIPLKAQITMSGVCRHLHDVITETWQHQYKTLHFSFYDFVIKQGLTATELRQFLVSVGQHVTVLKFDSTPYLDLCDYFQLTNRNYPNIMETIRRRAHGQFCKHLMLFENVTRVELLETRLFHFTVSELARHCPRLLELHSNSYTFPSEVIDLFPNLRALHIENCAFWNKELQPLPDRLADLRGLSFSLTRSSHNRFMTRPIALEMCSRLSNLTSLRMCGEMFSVLKCFFELPNLKHLSLNWPCNNYNCELKIMDKFSLEQKHNLHELKFSVGCLSDMQSAYSEITAEILEVNAAMGKGWLWTNRIHEYRRRFGEFSNLRKVSFEYCRPLMEHVKILPVVCPQLQEVKLLGCRSQTDEALQNDWQSTLGETMRCRLDIDGMEPEEVDSLLDESTDEKKDVVYAMDCYFP